ncbi:hypothetical protein EI94DRAFT_663085 [Lactarius quietus]|nr:hypothetical protein EI94DRAFT_663085 [Lactarius quietus]
MGWLSYTLASMLSATSASLFVRALKVCSLNVQPKSPLTLPTWLHDLFKSRIEELKQVFTCPLIKSSTIREKYLEALRAHAAPNRCTFCLGVHAMQGEWYCMQLEEVLSKAREKTPFISD